MGKTNEEDEADGEFTQKSTSVPPILSWQLICTVLSALGLFTLITMGEFLVSFIPFALLAIFASQYELSLTEAEKQWFTEKNEQLEKHADNSPNAGVDEEIVNVCRECRRELPEDVKRCPHCGWKPKRRGGLWWGTTALMSWNIIGWAMGAKGASDKVKADKGVTEEAAIDKEDSISHMEEKEKEDPIEKIGRLNNLKEKGVIDEEELEKKKEELLEQV